MYHRRRIASIALAAATAATAITAVTPALAAVSADDAAKLKTTLTPLGAERAANKDGSIPMWEGGLATGPAIGPGQRRTDPFADEKPLFSISAKNMAQYADKLTDGTKALMQKYPDYRIDVYKSHRTAAAPQYIYDRTASNATTVKTAPGTSAAVPSDYHGGIPFPIPQNGEEAMFNHVLRWAGDGYRQDFGLYTVTPQGRAVLQARNDNNILFPYNLAQPNPRDDSIYIRGRFGSLAPAQAKGNAAISLSHLDDDKSQVFIYLPGQRRVKLVPNACCDTPTPITAGTMNFDEINVFSGTLKVFDWKLVGKQETYIPYNSNRTLLPTKDAEAMAANFMNPDHVRWELHRVWVVEATLKPGKRHITPKGRYYLDEDTWGAVLADRWDAQGQLVKTLWSLPFVAPEVPVVYTTTFGAHDLLTGSWFINSLMNESKLQQVRTTDFSPNFFTPDALAGDGVR